MPASINVSAVCFSGGCEVHVNIAAVAEEAAGMTLGDGHCVCAGLMG